MARTSLKTNVRKPEVEKATEVAKRISIDTGQHVEPGTHELFETVSYNLPVDLIDLVRDLADARVAKARKEQRKAKRRGEKGPQARKSASAVVREAIEAYRNHIETELAQLRGWGASDV